jgi:hypothetical protein
MHRGDVARPSGFRSAQASRSLSPLGYAFRFNLYDKFPTLPYVFSDQIGTCKTCARS